MEEQSDCDFGGSEETTSAEEVALRIGVSKSALFMYERGERIPRDETKVLIAQYYGVSVEDLFFKQVEH